MTFQLTLQYGGVRKFERLTLFEIAQLVDNYSRNLHSGPWLLRKCGEGEWQVERIDCKIIGHVLQINEEGQPHGIQPV